MINVDKALKDAGPEVPHAAAGARRAAVRGRAGERDEVEKLVRDKMGGAYPLDVPLEVVGRLRPQLGLRRALAARGTPAMACSAGAAARAAYTPYVSSFSSASTRWSPKPRSMRSRTNASSTT